MQQYCSVVLFHSIGAVFGCIQVAPIESILSQRRWRSLSAGPLLTFPPQSLADITLGVHANVWKTGPVYTDIS